MLEVCEIASTVNVDAVETVKDQTHVIVKSLRLVSNVTMSDTEWLHAAQYCEKLLPRGDTRIIVKRRKISG